MDQLLVMRGLGALRAMALPALAMAMGAAAGRAAGLSTHWATAFQPNTTLPLAAFGYLRDRLPPPDGVRRLCMDHGTTGLDALYAPHQAFVNEIVRERGCGTADSALRVFEGTGHSERAWGARVHLAIEFLLAGR